MRSEAARYGVTIAGSEIVGLIPKRAIELTADFYLQLENFSPAQVLENRLADSLSGAPATTPVTTPVLGSTTPWTGLLPRKVARKVPVGARSAPVSDSAAKTKARAPRMEPL